MVASIGADVHALALRRIVVTGASSGIGRETAVKISRLGAVPLLIARRRAELEQVRRDIQSQGGRAATYPCDLTDPGSVESTVAQVCEDHPTVDMLVNNAGRSIRRPVVDALERVHDYERTMAVNYFGAVRLTLALLPRMLDQHHGHVVNVSSMLVQAAGLPRFSAYVPSKAAADAFADVLAAELAGTGVSFTTVHLPLVRTPMIAPTRAYDSYPAASASDAADLVVQALVRRRRHVGTLAGALSALAAQVAPGALNVLKRRITRSHESRSSDEGRLDFTG